METSYYKGGDEFIPVTVKNIRTGLYQSSDLYLKRVENKKVKYVLYLKGGNSIMNDKKEEIVRRNINSLFIRKNGEDKYINFIESNLRDIIIDKNEGKDVKAKVAYEVGMNMVEELLNQPEIEDKDMARAMDWVFLMINLFLENNYVYSNLATIMENDKNIFRHSVNITALGLLFAKFTGLDSSLMNKLGIGLLMHDIGMPKLNINNVGGEIGSDGTGGSEEIRNHPLTGSSILSGNKEFTRDTLLLVQQHHENYDGTGYPYKLQGDDIHLLSRYGRIVDEYDTLMMSRTEDNFIDRHFNVLNLMISDLKYKFDVGLLSQFVKFLATKHGGVNILNEFNKSKTYKMAG